MARHGGRTGRVSISCLKVTSVRLPEREIAKPFALSATVQARMGAVAEAQVLGPTEEMVIPFIPTKLITP